MNKEEAKQLVEIKTADFYPYLIIDNVDDVIDRIYEESAEQYFTYLSEQCFNYDLQFKKEQYRLILNGMYDFVGKELIDVLLEAKKYIEEGVLL